MIKYLFLLLVSIPAFGATSTAPKALPIIDVLENGNFQSGKAKWTASGGTFTIDLSTPLDGHASGVFTPSATGQTLSTALYPVPVGLQSNACALSMLVQSSETTNLYTAKVLDGNGVVLNSVQIPIGPNAQTVQVPFHCPGSGTIKGQIASSGSAAAIHLSKATLGESPLIQFAQNSIVGTVQSSSSGCNFQSVATSSYADMTVTSCTGSTTTGAISSFASGSNGAVTINSLPPGDYVGVWHGTCSKLNSDTSSAHFLGTDGTTVSPEKLVSGLSSGGGAGASIIRSPCDLETHVSYSTAGTHTFKIQSFESSGASLAAFDSFAAGEIFTLYGYPSQSQLAQSVNTQAASWTGYHNTSCVWAQASTTPADFTDAAGGCALVQRTNHNMGSVTTVGTVRPGITWQSAAGKTWRVCAAPLTVASVGSYGQFLLTDLSGNILGGLHHNNNAEMSQNFCVDYDATTSGSQGVKFQGLDNVGGSSSAIIEGIGSLNAIEWSLLDTTQSLPGAVLTGSVTSPSSGVENVVRLKITDGAGGACTASPCSVENSNNPAAISSVTRASAGSYTVNFATGIFSGTPVCTCSGGKSGTDGATVVSCGNTSSTVAAIDSISASTAALTDNFFSLICVGPK